MPDTDIRSVAGGGSTGTAYIETRNFINGEFAPSSNNKVFEVWSPYQQVKVADVFEASVDDVNRAVAAAKAAFPAWAALSPAERGVHLAKFAQLIRDNEKELAYLDTVCMGRCVSQFVDAARISLMFDYYATAGYDAKGITSLNTPGYVNMTFRQPFGPVAAIAPWNIPTSMFGMKCAPALGAGCTVVLKSSEKSPLSALKLAALSKEAGFPPGVLNVVSGYGEPVGSTLASHMDIRMISFTGSTATGQKIQVAAANSNLKKVVLELGGKSPCLVFEDADLGLAVNEAAFSVQANMGQACMANSRIYVQETIADAFIKAFVDVFNSARKGDPLRTDTEHGPQADKIQFERVKSYLKLASEGRGKLELGGSEMLVNGTGYFIRPTVYSNVPEDEQTQVEEVFGPFCSINTFKTEAEVIEKANATTFGLYASVYTQDMSRALRVAKAFESGSVGINCTSPMHAEDLPFGGYKLSGQGREGFGYSMNEYLEEKTVLIKLSGTPALTLKTFSQQH
ncbi:aldehyde dehydrogenase domain-containing protein [Dactylonectria macrodidyma]|uniref:aldehyde dehydrogenase (NAD(+)) n=1 Tax=Dactylonectria macrodidyma TaxID=307937 RepID=A0A9P9II33_9HYPO|nr:aldehyde dehydrogenase domain-containing protein [Dactylonectria macrodidyma]